MNLKIVIGVIAAVVIAIVFIEYVMGGIMVADMAAQRSASGLDQEHVAELVRIAALFDCKAYGDWVQENWDKLSSLPDAQKGQTMHLAKNCFFPDFSVPSYGDVVAELGNISDLDHVNELESLLLYAECKSCDPACNSLFNWGRQNDDNLASLPDKSKQGLLDMALACGATQENYDALADVLYP